jgi:hypothetical protein
MASLHIEHPITDLPTWTAAFSSLAEVRQQAGVRREQVRHPVGDARFVVVDLEFESIAQAETFLGFLQSQVWALPENSPALAGTPEAKILESVELT